MNLLQKIKSLLFLVGHNLRQHALSTTITVLSVGLATGLTMAVFSIQQQSRSAFTGGSVGFDAVLGARGSQLQLVLNAVFQLETSPGNIPWALYEAVKNDPRVQLAIPYAVGDNYLGFRIVGTTDEIFTKFEYQKGRHLTLQPDGRFFDPTQREAVIGSFVSQKTRLKVGDTFKPYHGLFFDPNMQHEEVYTVVGVLKPTNTPSDRVVWIPIDGVYRMKGHVLRGTGKDYTAKAGVEIPDANKEVSSVMLKFYNPQAGFMMDQTINRQGKVATLAWPIGKVMAELFDKMGWVSKVLTLVAYLVMLVAAGSILSSLYNTLNERRREFAILRALGAKRSTVFSSILLEASFIAGLGSLAGYAIYLGIFAAAAVVVRRQTGVVLDVFQFHAALAAVPIGMTVLGALSGFIPAFKAYSTDVVRNLDPLS
ncbi:MAG TPA: ABC transporter permease [bacterium]|nr:ABC transporter permease [bacterium]